VTAESYPDGAKWSRAVGPPLRSYPLEETRHQVERLDQIGQRLGIRLSGKKCKAMEGLFAEGAEVIEADGPGSVIDAALIAAAQRVEHYEISAYGSARALANHLGHDDIVELLQETLDE
jgi:ferritin-like metal-binding protein YciE